MTESTMLTYLGIIEQRANEIIQAHSSFIAHSQPSSKQPASTVLGAGPSAPVGSSNVEILPPSTAEERHSDEESDEEVDDRPLTRDELQARTLRNLSKRDSRNAQRRQRKK